MEALGDVGVMGLDQGLAFGSRAVVEHDVDVVWHRVAAGGSGVRIARTQIVFSQCRNHVVDVGVNLQGSSHEEIDGQSFLRDSFRECEGVCCVADDIPGLVHVERCTDACVQFCGSVNEQL